LIVGYDTFKAHPTKTGKYQSGAAAGNSDSAMNGYQKVRENSAYQKYVGVYVCLMLTEFGLLYRMNPLRTSIALEATPYY